MPAFDALLDRPTPLLRFGRGLLKLELLRPTGGTEDRAVSLLTGSGVLEATSGAALAAAAWSRARKLELVIRPRGRFTHEVRETLRIWGVRIDPEAQPTLPSLDSEAAVALYARSLGAELPETELVIAPAGARAALLGCRARERLALIGADSLERDELPDLPRETDLPSTLRVSRDDAAAARQRLSRELGLLASHAGAAAAVVAFERGGIALLTAAGEREFSLDRAP